MGKFGHCANLILSATAMQNICLAKALLLIREFEVYDRRMMTAERHMKIKEQITDNLNYLWGIALSADDEPSLRIMACHALCACTSLSSSFLHLSTSTY